ncbi:glycoside hydrolase family 92 protein [Arenibacter aquaticus]|uniref:Glycoside hydrolase family 92 protein n=1 Tax=Arenibacter aquaticus TaxID=2489054 RepID=A0A430K4T0_9FLAO|nr:GH92 family glycosyl hydrolase [Arenibacter aquaticus]RTE53979.1 glycoside hydrolase family 92 protein [Arenibacter aquaticus]
MKKLININLLCFVFCLTLSYSQEPVDYVDPFIGTHDSRPLLFPGATLPFGMVKLSPDNQKSNWKAGHDYAIKNIAGFNFVHDYHLSTFYVLPVTGKIQTQPGTEVDPDLGYRSRINNDNEQAAPGYYAVNLEDYGVKAELSSTTRVGIQRYTFPKSNESRVMFDFEIPYEDPGEVLEVVVNKVSDTEIEGYIKVMDRQNNGVTIWLHNDYYLYFVTRVDKPFKSLSGWHKDKIFKDVNQIKGSGDVGCFLDYNTEKGDQINVHTALSMVSTDQARLNLNVETREYGFNFDRYRANARKVWNNLLGKIKIKDNNEKNKVKFYTNLYRTYCAKTIWSDVNGKWVDMNEDVVSVAPGTPIYGADAFWGMKWNLNGLWSLVNPSLMNSWVTSLLEIYKRGGWLPKGPNAGEYSAIMTSSPAVSFITAAYQQGIRDYDVDLAYEAISKIMKEPGRPHKSGGFVGNRWLRPYMDYGYVPLEYGPASNTMELAFQDWCVAQMAKDLGKMEDYEYFLERSKSYKNHLDQKALYARIRSSSGEWIDPMEPFSSKGFIEGNAWQYTFYAPHDVQSIINFLGKEKFVERLEWGFNSSQKSKFNATGDQYAKYPINHGNQPNMQAAYLFNYAGKPWLTQKWVREILNVYYGETPEDGWPGDEDQGQMGGWFVMSSLGLFQMQGGSGVTPIFDLGSPLFERTEISLENGKEIKIIAKNNSDRNRYIQSAKFNGKPLHNTFIEALKLQKGGKLEYVMGPEPNVNWGVSELPPSMSEHGKWENKNETGFVISAKGIEDHEKKTFMDSVLVTIHSNLKNGTIRYTIDGSIPNNSSAIYSTPLKFMETVTVTATVFNPAGKPLTKIRKAKYEKINYENNITRYQKTKASLLNPGYEPSKAVDGFVDRDNFWDASPFPQWWSIELETKKEVNEVHLFTYWDGGRYYQYSIDASVDGINWKTIVDANDNTTVATKEGYIHKIPPTYAKYFRVNMSYNSANAGVHIAEFRVY